FSKRGEPLKLELSRFAFNCASENQGVDPNGTPTCQDKATGEDRSLDQAFAESTAARIIHGINRPIQVQFGPDGALYLVDSPAMGLTYRDAGVDIDEGDALVERIKPHARRTLRPEVLAGIGGFGGLFEVPKGYREPVLVAGTDGVGTKLKLAFTSGRHETVGIDLVAMSVNDVVVCGAEPVVFLDYFATSRLRADQAERVIAGVAEGCMRAGCALIGGETAELPGFYGDGEYDLAGFCVGVVEKSRILDGSRVRAGDVVLGMASSG